MPRLAFSSSLLPLILSTGFGAGGPGGGPAAPDAAAPAGGVRVRYCAVAGACALQPPQGFSPCVSTDDGPPIEVQRCIAAARDCAAARACTFDGRGAGPSLCTFGEKPRCAGTVALTCDGMTTTTSELDCALSGLVCVASATAARCALASCDAPGGQSYCQGTIAVESCARPFLRDGVDCAAGDAECAPPEPADGGVARCRGRGDACSFDICDGATVVRCTGGRAARVACPAGERCFGPSAVYTRPTCAEATECNPGTHYDRCDPGGVLLYCRRGHEERIDCRALGFAGCRPSPASGCTTQIVEMDGGRPLGDGPLP